MPPPPFEIRTSFTPDTLIVTAAGEIDMTTSGKTAEAIEAASERVRRVVVDLTEVTFVDSSGLNAFLRSQRHLAERGIELRIVAPSSGLVRRVFEISQLVEPLHVVETVGDALS